MYVLKLISRLLLLTLLLSTVQCEEKKPTIYKMADKKPLVYQNKWLADANNFEKSDYKKKFNEALNKALEQKDYQKSSNLFLSVFEIMADRDDYENHYIKLLTSYIEKHESNISIDDLLTLYIHLGTYENWNTNYQGCIKILNKAVALEPYNFHTYSEQGFAYYYISNSYMFLGDIEKALEENQKALLCFKRTDDYLGYAFVYHNIANINFETKNIQEAIKAIDQAIKYYKKAKDNEALAPAFLNKYEFIRDKDPEKANAYLDTIGDLINQGLVKKNQSVIHYSSTKLVKYLKEKNIKELDQLIPKVDVLVKQINLQYWENMIEWKKSKYQILKYNKILNKDKLLSILEFYKEKEDILYASSIIEILKDEAIANNDLKKVLEYDAEIEVYDNKIQEKDFQFKVNTYEKKIDTAKKEKIIAQQNNKLAKSYNYILLLLGIVFSIVVFFWIYSLRRKRKQAIVEQLKQEQFTFQLLQNTEEERNRIANELHDSVNHDLLNIRNKVANKKTIETTELEQVINEVRNISRNLYPAVLENLGLEASIEALCERVTNESSLFTTCEINYKQHLSKSKELQLYRIIQEALNNTLKHGNANAAKVILNASENQLHIEIKDNGKGFDYNEKLNSKTSFGLQSILQRAKAIAAKIDIRSNQFGTVILLKIPL